MPPKRRVDKEHNERHCVSQIKLQVQKTKLTSSKETHGQSSLSRTNLKVALTFQNFSSMTDSPNQTNGAQALSQGHRFDPDQEAEQTSLVADCQGILSDARTSRAQAREFGRSASTSEGVTPTSTDAVLRDVLKIVKDTAEKLDNLRESSEKKFQEMAALVTETRDHAQSTRHLAENMSKAKEQMQSFQEYLMEEIKKLTSRSHAEGNGSNFYDSTNGKEIQEVKCYLKQCTEIGCINTEENNKMGPKRHEEEQGGTDNDTFLKQFVLNPACIPAPLNSPSGNREEAVDTGTETMKQSSNLDSVACPDSRQQRNIQPDSRQPTRQSNIQAGSKLPPNQTSDQTGSRPSSDQTILQTVQNESGKGHDKVANDHSQTANTESKPKQPSTSEVMSQKMTPEATQNSIKPDVTTRGARSKEPKVSPVQSGSRKGLHLGFDVSGDPGSRRLREALERAQAPDPNPPPKAKSFDTIICLDVSESMRDGDAFDQMMTVVNKFINGIEDGVCEVEENIALVTFGGTADVVQHLTNDFSLVRDALERIEIHGNSPFYEAMAVCITALDGTSVSVSREYDVHPRIIFVTDGHITEGSDSRVDKVSDPTNTRASFSRMMMELNPKKHPSVAHPIVFVPVGDRADTKFLKSMAQLGGGLLVEPENLASHSNYFQVQETIGKVISCLVHHKGSQGHASDENIVAVIHTLGPNLPDKDIEVVKETVKREIESPSKKRNRTDPTAFDDVLEDTVGVASGDRLPLGARVIRGPDWRWKNQDSGGPGTVIQHGNEKPSITWVLWDGGGWNCYPYGQEMGYDIWATTECPVLLSSDGKLRIGMKVKKSRNWSNSEMQYDREPGVIIRLSKDKQRLQVRWSNGVILACPASAVEYSDPFEEDTVDQTFAEDITSQDNSDEEEEGAEFRIPVWQWKDDRGNWRVYTKKDRAYLEAAYQRKKDGTGIITREGKQFRVLFKRKTEKDIQLGIERHVQRVLLSEQELLSLEKAEDIQAFND